MNNGQQTVDKTGEYPCFILQLSHYNLISSIVSVYMSIHYPHVHFYK